MITCVKKQAIKRLFSKNNKIKKISLKQKWKLQIILHSRAPHISSARERAMIGTIKGRLTRGI